MINLLPVQSQKELQAGMTNSILIRYVILIAVTTGVVVALIALTFFQLNLTKNQAEKLALSNQEKVASFSDIESRTAAFKSDLALAKQIMDSEIHYTELLTSLASSLPSGVVMDQVSLDTATFGTPTTLSFQANSYQTAIKLKDSLQNSSMFQDVSFSSLAQSTEPSDAYPFTVQMNLTIVKPPGGA